jgi:hypothetical protein
MSGIQIGDKLIKFLSGPISYYFLTPKPSVYEAYHKAGLDLPIYLLFGDQHFSFSNMCNIKGEINVPKQVDGSCPNAKNCYRIYDDSFLSALDELAERSDYPIDFYSELHDNTTKETVDDSFNNVRGPLSVFNRKLIECFDPATRGHNCKYPHIRWQYGDIRNTMSGFISQLDTLYQLIRFRDEELTENHSYPILIDLDLVANRLTPLFITTISEQMLCSEWGEINYPRIFEVIFHFIEQDPNDKFVKQIKKQRIREFRTIAYWRKLMYDNFMNYTGQSTTILYPEEYNRVISTLASPYIIVENYRQYLMLLHFAHILLDIISEFMNVYFLMRTFKTPTPRPNQEPTVKNSSNPTLVVSYFGNAHTTHIVSILTELMKLYEIKYSTEKLVFSNADDEDKIDQANRCLTLSGRPFNIDYYVQTYNNRRRPIRVPSVQEMGQHQEAFLGKKKLKNRYRRYLYRY